MPHLAPCLAATHTWGASPFFEMQGWSVSRDLSTIGRVSLLFPRPFHLFGSFCGHVFILVRRPCSGFHASCPMEMHHLISFGGLPCNAERFSRFWRCFHATHCFLSVFATQHKRSSHVCQGFHATQSYSVMFVVFPAQSASLVFVGGSCVCRHTRLFLSCFVSVHRVVC